MAMAMAGVHNQAGQAAATISITPPGMGMGGLRIAARMGMAGAVGMTGTGGIPGGRQAVGTSARITLCHLRAGSSPMTGAAAPLVAVTQTKQMGVAGGLQALSASLAGMPPCLMEGRGAGRRTGREAGTGSGLAGVAQATWGVAEGRDSLMGSTGAAAGSSAVLQQALR
jgi:hypothetical protein